MHSRANAEHRFVGSWSSGRRAGLTAVVLLSLFLHPIGARGRTPGKKEKPSWMTVDTGSKTVKFQMVAAKTQENAGLNFNGHAKGDMTIVVPTGWQVEFVLTNDNQSMAHSLEVVDVQKSLPVGASSTEPAFPQAETASPASGILAGKTQSFDFSADEPGKYWLICGVPGHAIQGMWDYLEVSSSASSPYVTVGGS